jgi:hypothetical protein
MAKTLKLRARDAEDLQIIAACLQDALVSVSDMTFLPAAHRFAMVLNRFRWETAPTDAPAAAKDQPEPGRDAVFDAAAPLFERRHCGLCFDRVRTVHTRGIDRRARGRILELLTIQAKEGRVTLLFAENAAVMLEVDAIRCHMEDLGEGWPTRWRPRHGEGGGEGRRG